MGRTEPPNAADKSGNDKVKTARLRTESPTHRGKTLSRQELGELVAAYVYNQYGQVLVSDENWVGKVERGEITWPRQPQREALRAILGAPTDEVLGLHDRRRRAMVKLDDMDRRQMLKLGAATALSPVAAALEGLPPTPVPNRVGATEVQQVVEAAQVFASWDQVYGSGPTRAAVMAQLRWSAGLLDGMYSSKLRSDLYSAVGYLSHTCGMVAFDAYAHDDARRVLRLALACAEEAGNWHLRAKVYSSLARQAVWLGDPDEGLTYTEHALVRSDRLTATERAMLNSAKARALARMLRIEDCMAAVGSADDSFAASDPAVDPSWMAYYDEAQHNGDTGHALWDLSINGHPTEAADRFAAAVGGHKPSFARSRAISRTKWASLVMATGDPQEAAAIGRAAVLDAAPVRSHRLADDLRDLSRFAEPHSRLDEVAALRHDIASAVLAT